MQRDHQVTVSTQAIDLGYFSTKICFGKDETGRAYKTFSFPSIAARIRGSEMRVSNTSSRPAGYPVQVNGQTYYVGSDVLSQTSGTDPREVSDKYLHSDQYAALMKGALCALYDASGATYELVVENLILGLPVANYHEGSRYLSSMAAGEHVLPGRGGPDEKRRLTVNRVTVLMQPEGALMSLAERNMQLYKNKMVLIIDVGGGTLDWYANKGDMSYIARSGSHTTAMLTCAAAVVDKINPKLRDSIEIMGRIDLSIRTGDDFNIGSKTYKIEDFRSCIDTVWDQALHKMSGSIGRVEDYDCLYLTGGGASSFGDYLSRRDAALKELLTIDERPVYANVIGYYIAGNILKHQGV